MPQNLSNCGIGGCVNDGIDCYVSDDGGGASVGGYGVMAVILVVVR